MDTLDNGAVRVRNPSVGLWSAEEAWRPLEVLRIGAAEGPEPYTFADVRDVTIDENGRIYVLDNQLKVIRVFGPEGEHVRTLGREGRGPGEFINPTGMAWGPAGRLWVVDPGNARYSIYDTAGAYVASYRREVGGYSFSWDGVITPQGRLYDISRFHDPATDETRRLLIGHMIQRELAAVDTIELPQYRMATYRIDFGRAWSVRSVPFAPGLGWRLDPHGGLWLAVTDRYRLVHRDLEGDTTRIVEKEQEPVPVTRQERSDAIARIQEYIAEQRSSTRLDYSLIPDVKPAFQFWLWDDADYLWVARTAAAGLADGDGVVFDVFDPAGRYLGEVPASVDLQPAPKIIGNRLVGLIRSDLGVPYVVVYRLEGRT